MSDAVDDLEFPEFLKTLPGRHEVAAAFLERIRRFGYTSYAIGSLHRLDRPDLGGFLVHNWPEAWIELYADCEFWPDDPMRLAALVSQEPVSLHEIRTGMAGFLPSARGMTILDEAARIGRGAGLVVPVFGLNGYRGIVTMNGPFADPSPRDRALLHLWSIYAHKRLREIFRTGPGEEPPVLTQREIEVLRGARNGLEDEAIARNLQISVRTVRFHFENAKRKLGCRTRPEAVATADGRDLLV